MGSFMGTKEKILDAALSLFAEYGYNGTSVEEIAKKVGIKAPSLYKHYKGKEDILNALIDAAESRYEMSFGSEQHIGDIPASREEFIQSALEKVSFTLHDPMIRKIRIFLVQEQFRNERLAEITTRHQLDGLLHMYTRVLSAMMETGAAAEDDPEMLAMELIAPASLLISKADRQPECGEEIMTMVEKHIRHFCREYLKE